MLKRSARTLPARHGLTLIELMVALVVLGAMLAMALPSVGSWLRNTQIRNAAESLSSGLQLARAEAVRRNQNVMFSLVSTASGNPGLLDASCALSASSASWVVSLASPAGQCHQAPGSAVAPQILAKHARGDGAPEVSLAAFAADCSTAATASQLTFNGYGRLATASGLRCLKLTHANADTRPLHVLISSSGTVRTCDPAVTATDDPRRCALS